MSQAAANQSLHLSLGDKKGLADALLYDGAECGETAEAARSNGGLGGAWFLCRAAAERFAEAADLYRELGDDVGVARIRELEAELARQQEGQN